MLVIVIKINDLNSLIFSQIN